MDITLAGAGVTYQPSDDDLGGLSIELAAFDGEVGIGQVPMPDPAAAISVYDGRAIRIEEGATRLTDGFIIDQDRDRGPVPAGTAREHTFSAMDANALLDGFRITNRHRGSETDVARVLAFAALDGPTWDTTWVLDVDTVTMAAKVYDADGGWPAELIPDLVEVTGKTLWLHDLTDGSGRCLHYHNLQSGHGCGLSINDGKRYDAGLRSDPTVFEPWNPRRQRTSVDLRNDILGRDQKGRTSHATDATSISRHDADGLRHQSLQTFETTGQADLNVKTAAYLASQKDERDSYTLSIGPLDATALALIRNGDIINVTSSVLGLTASDERIAHMTLKPWIGEQGTAVPDLWLADLELGAPVRRRSRRRNKVIVLDVFSCIPTDFTVLNIVGLPQTFVVMTGADEADSIENSPPTYVHLYNGATYRLDYAAFWGPTSDVLEAELCDSVGNPGPTDSIFGMGSQVHGTETPFASLELTIPLTGDYGARLNHVGTVGHSSADSTLAMTVTWLSGPDPRFEDLTRCSNGEPMTGQAVRDADTVGDGSTTAATTEFPYRAGSLHVDVNGLDWTAQVTETDPTTGDYDLAYAPPLGSTVRRWYAGA